MTASPRGDGVLRCAVANPNTLGTGNGAREPSCGLAANPRCPRQSPEHGCSLAEPDSDTAARKLDYKQMCNALSDDKPPLRRRDKPPSRRLPTRTTTAQRPARQTPPRQYDDQNKNERARHSAPKARPIGQKRQR
ncbi:hypothetical protein C8J57DRAFT_1503843 [Mycena rebaudengoi]|nr:hypothetical protein C8J57DRAFT_1503843 [Mycena rebaudengoi]